MFKMVATSSHSPKDHYFIIYCIMIYVVNYEVRPRTLCYAQAINVKEKYGSLVDPHVQIVSRWQC